MLVNFRPIIAVDISYVKYYFLEVVFAMLGYSCIILCCFVLAMLLFIPHPIVDLFRSKYIAHHHQDRLLGVPIYKLFHLMSTMCMVEVQ